MYSSLEASNSKEPNLIFFKTPAFNAPATEANETTTDTVATIAANTSFGSSPSDNDFLLGA